MDSFEIRKDGELIETICAHEFKMQGKNAVFSAFDQILTVIALEPGMRVDRACDPEPSRLGSEEIAARHIERMKQAGKWPPSPPSNVIAFPR